MFPVNQCTPWLERGQPLTFTRGAPRFTSAAATRRPGSVYIPHVTLRVRGLGNILYSERNKLLRPLLRRGKRGRDAARAPGCRVDAHAPQVARTGAGAGRQRFAGGHRHHAGHPGVWLPAAGRRGGRRESPAQRRPADPADGGTGGCPRSRGGHHTRCVRLRQCLEHPGMCIGLRQLWSVLHAAVKKNDHIHVRQTFPSSGASARSARATTPRSRGTSRKGSCSVRRLRRASPCWERTDPWWDSTPQV